MGPTMLSQLRSVLKEKTYCEIKTYDEEVVLGFITRVSGGSFDVLGFDVIMNPNKPIVFDPSDSFFDDTEAMLVKRTFDIQSVSSIMHDVTHQCSPDLVKVINFYRDYTIAKKQNGTLVLKKKTHKVVTKRNQKTPKKAPKKSR